MLNLYNPDRDIIWVDSMSMHRMVSRVRRDASYRSATRALYEIGPAASTDHHWFFFTAAKLEGLPDDMQMALPFFQNVVLQTELTEKLRSLASGTRVAIGISAPKQNLLAAEMHAVRPDLEYHCFGAAMAAYQPASGSKARAPSFAGSGLEWILFFVRSPRRTVRKIMTTIKEIFVIEFHAPSRAQFAAFSKNCAPASIIMSQNKLD